MKTVMVNECLLPKAQEKFYSQAERAALMNDAALPTGTRVFLARYVGGLAPFLESYDLPERKEQGVTMSGHVATLVVGALAMQVVTIRHDEARARVMIPIQPGPWHLTTIQIHPQVATRVMWPPPLSATNSGPVPLVDLSRRFVPRGALAYQDLLEIDGVFGFREEDRSRVRPPTRNSSKVKSRPRPRQKRRR